MFSCRSFPTGLALVLATLVAAPLAVAAGRSWPTHILSQTFGYTDQTPSDVPLGELFQGCPKRDCIPSIDRPIFLTARKAKFLRPQDLVLGLVRGGTARAYPTYILDRHEIVNDTVDGEPIAITWCPLCGSGLAFSRQLDGQAVELGVSGLLRESDLVFYDRTTYSLWQQVTGTAFVGPARGKYLEPIALAVTTWERWRSQHPDTVVLANDRRRPSKPAYGDYRTSERLMFSVSRTSGVLHPKAVVWGVELDGGSVVASEHHLSSGEAVRFKVGRSEVELRQNADGSVRATLLPEGRELVAHRMFWFAWYTFHPDTQLASGEHEE